MIGFRLHVGEEHQHGQGGLFWSNYESLAHDVKVLTTNEYAAKHGTSYSYSKVGTVTVGTYTSDKYAWVENPNVHFDFESKFPLDLTKASFLDIMNAFRYAHKYEGDNYYHDVFNTDDERLSKNSSEGGVFHSKSYTNGVKIDFVIPRSNQAFKIQVVEPYFPTVLPKHYHAMKRGWDVDETKIPTKTLYGEHKFPYTIAIFRDGADAQSNERLATIHFANLEIFQKWKSYIRGN